MAVPDPLDGRARGKHPTVWQTAAWTVFGAASGLATNIVSDTAYARGALGVALTLAGILAAAAHLRTSSPDASVRRWAPRLLLALAAVTTLVALVVAGGAYAVLAAAGFTALAVVIREDLKTNLVLLAGASSVGLGVASISLGVSGLDTDGVLPNAYVIVVGVVAVGSGVLLLARGSSLPRFVDREQALKFLVLGVMMLGAGIGGLAAATTPAYLIVAVAAIGVGVAGIGFALVILVPSDTSIRIRSWWEVQRGPSDRTGSAPGPRPDLGRLLTQYLVRFGTVTGHSDPPVPPTVVADPDAGPSVLNPPA